MKIEKNVLLVGKYNQQLLLKNTLFKIKKLRVINCGIFTIEYSKTGLNSNTELINTLLSITQKNRYEDLIIFIGFHISLIKDFINYLKDGNITKIRPSILFVVHSRSYSPIEGIKGIYFIDEVKFADEIQFRNTLDRLLGIDIENVVRQRISDQMYNDSKISNDDIYLKDLVKEDDAIDEIKINLIKEIKSSHYFDKDFLKNVHVLQNNDTVLDIEHEIDDKVIKFLKLDGITRFNGSIEDLHKSLQNDLRVVYLLVGRRGCGKSSFVHYYFNRYEPFIEQKKPFVIVDFFNFGFYPDKENVRYDIVKNIFNAILKNNLEDMLIEYPSVEHYLTEEIMEEAIFKLKNEKVSFNDVIPITLRLKILDEIDEIGRIHIGRSLAEDKILNEDDAQKLCKDSIRNDPWTWLSHITRYTDNVNKVRVIKYFTIWLLEKSFTEEKIGYSNSQLFRKNLNSFYKKNIKNANLNLLNSDELQNLLIKFITEVKSKIGRLNIVLDNVDRLSASEAEVTVLNSIKSAIAVKYTDVNIIMALRPTTLIRNNKILEFNELKDLASYDRVWINPIKLELALKKAIRFIQLKYTDDSEEFNFLNSIHDLLDYSITNQSDLNPDGVIETDLTKTKKINKITDLIIGLSGNNIRVGKELFSNLILSRYKRLNEFSGNGLFRMSINNKLIAEHIAIRAIFLNDNEKYEFDDNLVNLFNLNHLEGHASTLLQIRLLEILRRFRDVNLAKIFEYLFPLGYSKEQLEFCISNLRNCRLITTFPTDFRNTISNKVSIIIRYRGDFYLDYLISSLEYIQMVYFSCNLINKYSSPFSFPNPPKVQELKLLVDNFLLNLWHELSIERKIASESAIKKYEMDVTSLDQIHNTVSNIYFQLKKIGESELKKMYDAKR